MSDARSEILARIRLANEAARMQAQPVVRAYRRSGSLPPGSAAVRQLFQQRLVDYRAVVLEGTPQQIPDLVASALSDVSGPVLRAQGVAAEWCPPATEDDGVCSAKALDHFAAVITTCAAACAETGTIALDSSGGQGRRAISLIPDCHVCIVFAEQVVETVPEMLSGLDPARPLTLISGPSATSDIELRRVEGVHGPRTLAVVLVEPA